MPHDHLPMPFNFADRRTFLKGTAAAATAAALSAWSPLAVHAAAADDELDLSDRIYKTLKIGMVRVEGSLTDKFKAAKAAGFRGIELNAPNFDVAEVKQAIAESGLPVDGTVCSSHWQVRHTDPDPARNEGRLAQIAEVDTLAAFVPEVAQAGPASETLRRLTARVQTLERSVILLRHQKSEIPDQDYRLQLETLLIDLARSSRQLRVLIANQHQYYPMDK